MSIIKYIPSKTEVKDVNTSLVMRAFLFLLFLLYTLVANWFKRTTTKEKLILVGGLSLLFFFSGVITGFSSYERHSEVRYIPIEKWKFRTDTVYERDTVKRVITEIVYIKNDAAPAEVNAIVPANAKDYIAHYHKIATNEMRKFGIPASISLAQGLLESNAGSSKLAVQNNNHFGIKCFSRSCKKGHCTNFTDDSHKDFFRKYKKPSESWRAHSQLLASGQYAKLKRFGHDYRKWAWGLQEIGYATDKKYAEKIIGVIKRYDLYEYDKP